MDSETMDSSEQEMTKPERQPQTVTEELTRYMQEIEYSTRPARDAVKHYLGAYEPNPQLTDQELTDKEESSKLVEDGRDNDAKAEEQFALVMESARNLPKDCERDRRSEYHCLPLPGPIQTTAISVANKAADIGMAAAGFTSRTAQNAFSDAMDAFMRTQLGLTTQDIAAGMLGRLPLRRLDRIRNSLAQNALAQRPRTPSAASILRPVLPPNSKIKDPRDAPEGSNLDLLTIYSTVEQHGMPRSFKNSMVDHEKREEFKDVQLDIEEVAEEECNLGREDFEMVGIDANNEVIGMQ